MVDKKTSEVSAPPPIVYLVCILVGVGLEVFLPAIVQYIFGVSLIIFSFVLFALVLKEFSRSSTSVDHRKETTQIISSGPFRYSRNPVYLSMTILAIGIAVTSGSIWILIMTIPAVIVTQYMVIFKEEKYLEEKFGEEYLQYKNSVRRWL